MDQVLSECHVTLAPLAAPLALIRAKPVPVAPLAWFQLVSATTPADSVAAIAVLLPTKLTLMAEAAVAPPVITSWTVVVFTKVPLAPLMVTV